MQARFERLLVVTADDFGMAPGSNAGIAEAHDRGVLTAASLMVNEPGADDAVRLARTMPSLAVGLHLALSDGRAALDHSRVPAVVAPDGRFRSSPAIAGLVYFFSTAARKQVAAEMEEQFGRYARSGLRPSHVDGHQHLHVHPVLWDLTIAHCVRHGIRWIRVPREPLRPGLGALLARRIEWAALRCVSIRCAHSVVRSGIGIADHVFGHLHSGMMTEDRLLRVLDQVPVGLTEVYLHPGASPTERRALVSPSVRERIAEIGATLTTFAALSSNTLETGAA